MPNSSGPQVAASSAEKFKAAGLRQRVITAVVITGVFVAVVLCTSLLWFQLLVGLLLCLAAWEWSNLSGCTARPLRAAYVAVTLLGFYLLSGLLFPAVDQVDITTLTQLFITAMCFWAWVLVLVLSYPRSAGIWASQPVRLLMGWLLLLPCLIGLVFLKQQDNSGWLVLWAIAVVAVADIGAYFAGVRFGQHKLAPRVSPGKSWEGVLGGVVANGIFALLLAAWGGVAAAETVWLVLAMLGVGALSVLGDLFESMVKRQRGVKDSGNLLPGHGGILDRIDGWTVAIPVFVLAYLYGVAQH